MSKHFIRKVYQTTEHRDLPKRKEYRDSAIKPQYKSRFWLQI